MNKQKSQMKVLLGILAAVIILLAVVLIVQKINSNKEAAETASKVLYEIELDDVTGISYEYEGQTIDLSRDESGDWSCDTDSSLSIDSDSADSLVENALSLSYEETVEDAEELSEYGLEEPSNTIVIETADSTYTLVMGDENEISGNYYMLFNGDDSTVYLIPSTIPEAFSVSLDSLLEDASE